VDNQVSTINELNFFQKIRKQSYLKNLTKKKAKKYITLPEYLKNDLEVIQEVCATDPSLINYLPDEKVALALTNSPQLINDINDISKIAKILEYKPEISQYINDKNIIYNLIFFGNVENKSFIRFLGKDLQDSFLSGKPIEYERYFPQYNEDRTAVEYYEKSATENKIYKGLVPIESLDFDMVLKTAIDEYRSSKPPTVLKDFDLTKLPIANQLKLLLLTPQYADFVSYEAVETYVGKNPLVLETLPENIQYSFIKKNPEMFSKMSLKFQNSYRVDHIYEKLPESYSTFNVKNYSTPQQAQKRLMEIGYMGNSDFKHNGAGMQAHSDVENVEYIWEMGKFDPEMIKIYPGDLENYTELYRKLRLTGVIHYKLNQKDPDGEITRYIGGFERFGSNSEKQLTEADMRTMNRLAKFLTNDDIMEKIPQDILLKYVQMPTHEGLVEIVEATYGAQAANILKERPQITLNEIGNFYIFSPNIIEEFGEGAVHAALSVNSEICAEFSVLARNPQKMEMYRRFNQLTYGMFEDSVIGLNTKLRAFETAQDLLREIPDTGLTDLQRENLMLAFNDRLGHQNQIAMDFPSSLEALDEYSRGRNKLYDDAINRTSNINEIKNLMSQRYFGMEFFNSSKERYLREPTVSEMVKAYNLDYFVNHEKTLGSGEYTQDDLDALELMSIFSSITDGRVLKELSNVLSNKENVINPINYSRLRSKVPLTYTKDFVDSLITPEKAMQMVEEGKEGIALREVNGIKIITLSGVDFTAYVTNPFMNASKVKDVNASSLAETWKNFENGISTFSGCAIDQDEPTSTIGSGGVGLGFGSIDSSQIVGMGTTDINVTHKTRSLEPELDTGWSPISYKYSKDFMTDTASRLENGDSNTVGLYTYNEVASNRRKTNISDIKPGEAGGKIIPDYIYVKGDAESTAAIGLAKQFGIEYVFEHVEEAYIGRAHSRALQKQNQRYGTKREISQFMKDVKRVSRGDIGDEGR